MITAIPKRQRPHQVVSGPSAKIESLKQKLIRRIVSQDEAGAEAVREQMRVEEIKLRVSLAAANSGAMSMQTSTPKMGAIVGTRSE